jgi:hypothetical protein
MNLAPHEKRILAGIENSLRSTDPALATMLARFTVPGWRKTRLLGLPRRFTKVSLTAVFFAFAAAGLMLWTLLSAPAHQQCSSPQQGLPGLTFTACAPAHPSGK